MMSRSSWNSLSRRVFLSGTVAAASALALSTRRASAASPAKTLDVYVSYRSPYSYLAGPRLQAIAHNYDIEVRLRPVYPLATRSKNFFQDKDALWIPYVLLDTKRIAEMLGMPMIHPQPDPIVQNYETREIPEYQPYIWRLTRLGQAAAEAGKSLDFYCEVSRTIYTVPGWNEGDHLAQAAARAGLDLAALDAKVTADPKRLDEVIEANQNALHAAGHWGVPTMVFEGEPFFGQDRIDVLLWRMKQRGVELRAGGAPLPDMYFRCRA